jgi:hypothetical protein
VKKDASLDHLRILLLSIGSVSNKRYLPDILPNETCR